MAVYSSLSVACPVIWGHRYDCLFFFVPGLSHHLRTPVWLFILLCPWLVPSSSIMFCLLSCPLSVLCHLSFRHLSTLGLVALFVCSLVCPHLAFFSLSVSLSSSSHGRPLESFFCTFLGRLSNVKVNHILMHCCHIAGTLPSWLVTVALASISVTSSVVTCPLVASQIHCATYVVRCSSIATCTRRQGALVLLARRTCPISRNVTNRAPQ